MRIILRMVTTVNMVGLFTVLAIELGVMRFVRILNLQFML